MTRIIAPFFLTITLVVASSTFGQQQGFGQPVATPATPQAAPAKPAATTATPAAAAPAPKVKPTPSTVATTEAEVKERLERKISLDLDENKTFEDLAQTIAEKTGIQVFIDAKGAGALGITMGSPVIKEPLKCTDITLTTVLRRILAEQDLTYVIDDGMLLITSVDEAKTNHVSIKIYDVGDILKSLCEENEKSADYWGNLMDVIETVVQPDSWNEGGQMMELGSKLLVVRQTNEVHDELAAFFKELRDKIQETKKDAPTVKKP